jgi:hypothetical protein
MNFGSRRRMGPNRTGPMAEIAMVPVCIGVTGLGVNRGGRRPIAPERYLTERIVTEPIVRQAWKAEDDGNQQPEGQWPRQPMKAPKSREHVPSLPGEFSNRQATSDFRERTSVRIRCRHSPPGSSLPIHREADSPA